jgi:hypothetical protein
MGGIVNKYPFSIFKQSDRTCFSVAFKSESGKYLKPLSTGKKTEDEAFQVAFQWLRDGVPQKRVKAASQALNVNQLALRDLTRKIETKTDVEIVLKELKRKSWLKNYVLADTPAARDFVTFLTGFWDWETSDYIKEKRRKNHSIHESHCVQQAQAVKQYFDPFFKPEKHGHQGGYKSLAVRSETSKK